MWNTSGKQTACVNSTLIAPKQHKAIKKTLCWFITYQKCERWNWTNPGICHYEQAHHGGCLVALYDNICKRQLCKKTKQLISAISLLFSTTEATPAMLGSVLGSSVKKRHGYIQERDQWKSSKMMKGLEHLSSEEKLRAETVQPGKGGFHQCL